jgi:hypothetical protein
MARIQRPLWRLLLLACLLAIARPAGAQVAAIPERHATAILVRLAPGGALPRATAAFGELEAGTLVAGAAARTAPVPDAEIRSARVVESLEAAGLAPLARAAGETGALTLERPFGDLFSDTPDEPLARVIRLAYADGADLEAIALRLRAAPGVESAQRDAVYHLAWADAPRFVGPAAAMEAPPSVRPLAGGVPFPDDPQFVDGTQWGLENTGAGVFGGVAGVDIRATAGWPITSGSTATVLGIVDTGFDLHHPELVRDLADGTPRVIRRFNSSIEGPSGTPDDSLGHGTIVAGVALGLTNNGPVLDGRGIAGVSGGSGGDSAGCRVVEIKATPTRLTDALASELANGISYAVIAGARAINLSFGGDEDNDTVRDAISFAQRRGAIVVCAAGNGQDERPQYPGYYAHYGDGVSVAAIKSDGTLARFSSRGPQIDVAAPGEDIMSTFVTYENAYSSPLRNFAHSSGTSFASPFVTGLAGLAFTLQPSLLDNEFQEVLRRTARDVGAPGRDDTFGWGIPDAPSLLTALLPPRGFVRGVVNAQSWSLVSVDSVTLSKTRMAVNGCSIDGRYQAERWEVRSHVNLPAGRLLEIPQVIVRTHGTGGLGGWMSSSLLEYDGLDWGELVPGTASTGGFDLRTYVYRISAQPAICTQTGPIDFVPQRPQDVQFAWSVLGRLDAPPVVTIDSPGDGGTLPVDAPGLITWHATDVDTVTGIQIAVSSDSGATWSTIANLAGDPGSYAYRSQCAQAGHSYAVRVRALDEHGGWSDQGEAVRRYTPSRFCNVGEVPVLPLSFALLPVTPNPSAGTTAFHFYLPEGAALGAAPHLRIYDIRGRMVREIPLAAALSGPNGAAWDGLDQDGRVTRTGMYVARLEAGGRSATERFVRLLAH